MILTLSIKWLFCILSYMTCQQHSMKLTTIFNLKDSPLPFMTAHSLIFPPISLMLPDPSSHHYIRVPRILSES